MTECVSSIDSDPHAAPDRRPRLGVDEFHAQYLRENRPVLLAEQGCGNLAVDRWDVEFFMHECGERSVDVEYYPRGRREQAFVYRTMRLNEYLALVRDDESARQHYYLAELPLRANFPDIADEIQRPAFVPDNDQTREVLFVGFDTLTTGHYHRMRTQAVLAQLSGTKTVVLFPPDDLKHLSLRPWYSLRHNHSQIPFSHGDVEPLTKEHPQLSRTRAMRCTVRPGDWLYIPDHWVHYVYSFGESTSVTWFWDSPAGTGFRSGIRRDQLAHWNKNCLLSATRLLNRAGLTEPLLRLAAKSGIIDSDERSTVADYLAEAGANLPSQRVKRTPK